MAKSPLYIGSLWTGWLCDGGAIATGERAGSGAREVTTSTGKKRPVVGPTGQLLGTINSWRAVLTPQAQALKRLPNVAAADLLERGPAIRGRDLF